MSEQFCSDIKRNISQRSELAKEVDSIQSVKKNLRNCTLNVHITALEFTPALNLQVMRGANERERTI